MSRPPEKHHFFWIDKKFVEDLYYKAIGRNESFNIGWKELQVYLLHLRSTNPKTGEKSLVGVKKSKEVLGIANPGFDNANKNLEQLNLLKIKKEAQKLPNSNGKRPANVYQLLSGRRDGEPRNKDDGKSELVFISADVIDDGLLKDLSFDTIVALLMIYMNLNLDLYWGISWQFLNMNENHKQIRTTYKNSNSLKETGLFTNTGEMIYEVLWPDMNNQMNEDWSGIAHQLKNEIKSLKESGFLEWVPILLQRHPMDKTIIEVKHEIPVNVYGYDELERKRAWTKPNDNEFIRWILRPKDKYLPRTQQYDDYHERLNTLIQDARASIQKAV